MNLHKHLENPVPNLDNDKHKCLDRPIDDWRSIEKFSGHCFF